MPVTPFHVGPAMLVKAACPCAFSLGVFAVVQAVIDVRRLARTRGLPGWARAELASLAWPAALVGAALGALSHVALDALVHADVQPLAPWVAGNPFFVAGSFVAVHVACAVTGALGFALWYAQAARRPGPAP